LADRVFEAMAWTDPMPGGAQIERPRMTPLIVPVVLFSLLSPTLSNAESICDVNSTFLSAQLRARWCGESEAVTRKEAAPRKPIAVSQRKPASNEDDDEDDDEGDEEEEVVKKPPPRQAARPAARPAPTPARPVDPGQNSAQRPNPIRVEESSGCMMKQLRFAANFFPQLPAANSNIVWGGNAAGDDGDLSLYSSGFSSRSKRSIQNGRKLFEVFAYLEGPCGNTAGQDDGEIARCRRLHNAYNAKYARGTSNSGMERWKPYTLGQMKASRANGVDHCEIDNLDNAVKIPLVPLFKEIKRLFDSNEIHCRLVLKNLSVGDINSIIKHVAPTPGDAAFISPFHIFEANNRSQKKALDAAMMRLKGTGSTTIISSSGDDRATEHYGEYFSKEQFMSCGK